MKGLTNCGNTCYLNAALQCLLYCPPLTNYILAGWADKDLLKRRSNACALANEYVSLAKAYWSQKDPPVLDSRPLWAALCKVQKTFANSQPHDAHEALVAVLKHLHESLGKTPRVHPSPTEESSVDVEAWERHVEREGYSVITELFQGQMESRVTAPGGYSSTTHEHFSGLSLDVGSCGSVAQALQRLLEPTRIEDFRTADGTPPVCATQVKRILYCPLLLVIHLKVLDAQGNKLDKFIDYSTTLDLPCSRYSLFAVCMHNGAHYVAACEAGDRWFLIDDASCQELQQVNSVIQRDAYMLLYKKLPERGEEPRRPATC